MRSGTVPNQVAERVALDTLPAYGDHCEQPVKPKDLNSCKRTICSEQVRTSEFEIARLRRGDKHEAEIKSQS